MSAKIHHDPSTLIDEIHISGILKRADMTAFETEMAARIEAGDRPLLLVTLENFAGWEVGEDWNNLDFMFSHGDKIARIAIVGAGAKEAEVKAFSGAGLRPTPVRFFTSEEIEAARAWLTE